MRQAVARYDYENVYTFPVITLGVALVLDAVALILGLIGVRQPTGKALSGAAIGIGVTGIAGVLIYVIGTTVIMPRIA
jgi:galactitol-specific phosphotransferase system IIC component